MKARGVHGVARVRIAVDPLVLEARSEHEISDDEVRFIVIHQIDELWFKVVLRELVAKVLHGYHYRVLEAETGVQALQLWEECHGKVDLLLTDMVMPGGVSGAELAHRLRQRKPDLRVIYTSGYSSEIVGKHFSENDPVFLPKPYRPPQLAHRVRKCLDAPPQPILEVAAA